MWYEQSSVARIGDVGGSTLTVRRCVVSVVACAAFALARAASAHDLPISEIVMVADEDYLHVEIMLNASDLNFVSELDADQNGRLESGEVRDRGPQIADRILEFLKFEIDGTPVAAETAGLVPDRNTHHLTVRAHYPGDARAARIALTSRLLAITRGAHATQATLRRPGTRQLARLETYAARAVFEGPPAPPGSPRSELPPPVVNSPSAPETTQPAAKVMGVLAVAAIVISGFALLIRQMK